MKEKDLDFNNAKIPVDNQLLVVAEFKTLAPCGINFFDCDHVIAVDLVDKPPRSCQTGMISFQSRNVIS